LIAFDNVSRCYGEHVALAPTTIAFPPETTTALIGPSGCGKSTLLRLAIGLIPPSTGRIRIAGETLCGENVNRLRHGMGYVIQEGGLFPHLSARANVTLLARHLRRTPEWIAARVAELADLVRLPLEILERFPRNLSGGQRQRVGLMRALMLDPPLLLLDEPLGALDPVTRFELQDELKRIFSGLRKSVIFVTHDMVEAAHFGDRIAILRAGHVLQYGTLRELLHQPAADYVRDFVRAQRRTFPLEAP